MNQDVHQVDYQLGIPIVDHQHSVFFGIISNLSEIKDDCESDDKVNALIGELQHYMEYHFRTEEELMKRARFSGIEAHLAQHRILQAKVQQFANEYDYKNRLLLEQMIIFLRKWHVVHLVGVDAEYVKDVKALLAEKQDAL